MGGIAIDSEKQENVITSDPSLSPSNHCLVVMEHEALRLSAPLPRWRVSVVATIKTGEEFEFYFPTITIGPLATQRQAVAIAHYPGAVERWKFGFESDHALIKATVWLLPGSSILQACGLFPVPFAP
jgi:hypothetical protein